MMSPRALEVLTIMYRRRDDPNCEGELVCSGLACWIGHDHRTNWRVVCQLLGCCFISDESDGGGLRRFAINHSGERFIEGELPYRDSEGKYHATLSTIIAGDQP